MVTTPKHYAVNNQEWERVTISAELDERTLREIYLPHFKAAVQEAGALSIMCSYNRINGVYACENEHLLTEILKDEWGFEGFVMSDWGAVHSTIPTVMSGMDVEMGTGKYLDEELVEAVRNGNVPEYQVDKMVRRVLKVMFTTGILDRTIHVDGDWLDSAEHRSIALQVAREGIVLLNNEVNLLPINKEKIRSIAVVGPNAKLVGLGGGGSSEVTPTYGVTPLEGILKEAGDDLEVRYAPGCDIKLPVDFEVIPSTYFIPHQNKSGVHGLKAEFFNSMVVSGDPVLTRIDPQVDLNVKFDSLDEAVNRDKFTARWEGRLVPPINGEYTFTAIGDGTAHLYIEGKGITHKYRTDIDKAVLGKAKLRAGRPYKFRFEYTNPGGLARVKLEWSIPGRSMIEEAAELAANSDLAVVLIGLDKSLEGETHDRDNIDIPGLQNDLVAAVAKANPNTVVVMVNGTPMVLDRWLDQVPAVIEAWYPGQEGGRALGEILFGDVNPSGKLPMTYPVSWEQSPAYGNYPGKNGKVHYEEGIFLGYRYYDKENLEPEFPFGHGLSYTEFKYDNLEISPATMSTVDDTLEVSLEVTNTGAREGREVVQLYVRDVEASVPRPVKELKGIRKINLKPGESEKVVFLIDRAALSFYDPDKKNGSRNRDNSKSW